MRQNWKKRALEAEYQLTAARSHQLSAEQAQRDLQTTQAMLNMRTKDHDLLLMALVGVLGQDAVKKLLRV
jgi:hypothetical protein